MAVQRNMRLEGRGRRHTQKGFRNGCVQGRVGCFGKLYISIGDLRVLPDRCPQLLFLSPKKNLEFSSIAAATVMFLVGGGVSLKCTLVY